MNPQFEVVQVDPTPGEIYIHYTDPDPKSRFGAASEAHLYIKNRVQAEDLAASILYHAEKLWPRKEWMKRRSSGWGH